MLGLREKIQSLVSQSSYDVIFNYASKSQQNVDINETDLTGGQFLVNMVEIESGQFVLNPTVGSFKEQYPDTLIQFLVLTEFDNHSIENDLLIDRCKAVAKEFLLLMEDKGWFEPLTTVTFFHVYKMYDDHTTGIEMALSITELNSQGVCL